MLPESEEMSCPYGEVARGRPPFNAGRGHGVPSVPAILMTLSQSRWETCCRAPRAFYPPPSVSPVTTARHCRTIADICHPVDVAAIATVVAARCARVCSSSLEVRFYSTTCRRLPLVVSGGAVGACLWEAVRVPPGGMRMATAA